MLPQSIPEILRMPLENLCLQIKSMREDVDVKEYLSLVLDPPEAKAIDVAWETLELVGAVEDGGMSARLTPMGTYLALLPVDLRLGKMLLLASIFGCLDPILTVAAILSNKPLFNNPMEARDEAKAARMKFFRGNSDLLTDVQAYNEAMRIRREAGMAGMRRFCDENFISISAIRDIGTLRQEFLQAFENISNSPLKGSSSTKSIASAEENLLKSIIFAGLGFMKLCKVKLPNLKFEKSAGGNLAKEMESREVKVFEREGEQPIDAQLCLSARSERVFLHPASTMFSFVNYGSPFLTYFSKSVTTKPFLRDGTEVPTYGVLLFGGKLRRVDITGGGLVVTGKNERDDFIRFRAWSRIGVLVNQLRKLLDAELRDRFEYGSINDISETSVVQVMKSLLVQDGAD
ncbi:HA2-domain-containing protein [Atractiella rhizophila]|nr:HA2-domain-containing protein [Atractiella rhizophila]